MLAASCTGHREATVILGRFHSFLEPRAQRMEPKPVTTPPQPTLTRRENEVLRLLSAGGSGKTTEYANKVTHLRRQLPTPHRSRTQRRRVAARTPSSGANQKTSGRVRNASPRSNVACRQRRERCRASRGRRERQTPGASRARRAHLQARASRTTREHRDVRASQDR